MDAIILAVKKENVIGQTIDITDGDNNTTWGEYLNSLAKIIDKPEIKRNMSKSTAMLVARFMIILYKVFRFNPWVTPMAVNIFTNQEKISIKKVENLIGYKPKIGYKDGMKQVEEWLKQNKDNLME